MKWFHRLKWTKLRNITKVKTEQHTSGWTHLVHAILDGSR